MRSGRWRCSVQLAELTLLLISSGGGGGVNWRLEWSRVVGSDSGEGMRLHLQVHLPRWGEDGRRLGGRIGEGGRWRTYWSDGGGGRANRALGWETAWRGPLHPGATRKMLRNLGKGVTGWLRKGGRRSARPVHRFRNGYFGGCMKIAARHLVVVEFFNGIL